MFNSCAMGVILFLFVAALGGTMLMQERASQTENSYLMTATAIVATNQWVETAIAQTATAKLFTRTPTPSPTP